MVMPLIWMKRGLPSENTVPAIERWRVGVLTVSFRKPSNTPVLSCVVIEVLMPRSAAITGAETMFTSGFTGFISPASTAQSSALMFIFVVMPSSRMLTSSIGSSVSWPTKAPRCPASLIQGPITLASSAVTAGMLSELVTAPVSR